MLLGEKKINKIIIIIILLLLLIIQSRDNGKTLLTEITAFANILQDAGYIKGRPKCCESERNEKQECQNIWRNTVLTVTFRIGHGQV